MKVLISLLMSRIYLNCIVIEILHLKEYFASIVKEGIKDPGESSFSTIVAVEDFLDLKFP